MLYQEFKRRYFMSRLGIVFLGVGIIFDTVRAQFSDNNPFKIREELYKFLYSFSESS